MRKIETRYYCDYCERLIGDHPHISISIRCWAGIVKPPEWKHKKRLEDRPYQFCDNDTCLMAFLIHNCTKKNLKRKKK